jgi:manganese transport protein
MGVWLMGDAPSASCWSSARVLSLQLPFALYPLIRMTGDKQLMGPFVNRLHTQVLAWFLFALISGANAWLIGQGVLTKACDCGGAKPGSPGM